MASVESSPVAIESRSGNGAVICGGDAPSIRCAPFSNCLSVTGAPSQSSVSSLLLTTPSRTLPASGSSHEVRMDEKIAATCRCQAFGDISMTSGPSDVVVANGSRSSVKWPPA